MAASQLLFSKIVVLGASGQLGRQVVEQALEKGHLVTAVVRNPEKFDLKHENLVVCKGDVFSPESLVPILRGQDAVLTCLGFNDGSFFRPTTMYSLFIKAIISAMETSGLERIVCVTGVYTQKESGLPTVVNWLLRPLTRSFIDDVKALENFLMESKLCYTIVRPTFLSNDPAQGNYVLAEDQTAPNASMFISRADVAAFMLASLQTQDWNRKGVSVSIKK